MKNLIDYYKIYTDEFVGSGAYSSVYKCKYIGPLNKNTIKLNSGIDLAIKIINISKLTPLSRKVINYEIKIMKLIQRNPHPNIIECYDIIIENEQKVYIIMEYCDSGDLRQYLKNPIKEKWCQYYFCQLTNGLKYLAKHNILHRDIKPRNILLTNNKKVLKIADFGFAKQTKKEINLYKTICGSPLYMAPELMGHNEYNKQTDLWSIGMILYEMLYGFHPYESCKNINQLINMHNNNKIEIPPKNTTNNNVSNQCLDLLHKLLQKQVTERITWDDYFSHMWVNVKKYNPTNNQETVEYKKEIYSTSLGSLPSYSSFSNYATKIKQNNYYNIKIIDNFIDNYGLTDSVNFDNNSPEINETTYYSDTNLSISSEYQIDDRNNDGSDDINIIF